jgi:bifunctional enzyme Fae/Hps
MPYSLEHRKENRYTKANMRNTSKLDKRKRYLQVALNSTLDDARAIVASLPKSDRIILEAGTPLIKRYGMDAIRVIKNAYSNPLVPRNFLSEVGYTLPTTPSTMSWKDLMSAAKQASTQIATASDPYIVADMKTMDRGETEVAMAAQAGASAVIALGSAPIETLNSFIAACETNGVDAMIDMMNIEFPLGVLRQLKKPPAVVILHRGVDEEALNREKQIPLHEIRRIVGNYDIMISIAGGDSPREVKRAVFNDADIVVIWKAVYQNSTDVTGLVEGFLKDIK